MGKRGNGEGSVYQRASDGKWCATIRIDGKRRPLYGKTRKEVVDKLRKAQRDTDDGVLVVTTRRTVEQFMHTWLTECCSHVRASTLRTYRGTVERYIVPKLGRIELRALTAEHVQRLLNDVGKCLAPNSVAIVRMVLNIAMKQAMAWGLVNRNVVALVKPPRVPEQEYVTLTTDQVRAFLQHVRGDPWEAAYNIAIHLGLRIGEIRALRWQDVDLEARQIHVRKALPCLGEQTLQELKTRSSRRVLPLSETLITQLHQQRVRQLEQKLRAGTLWEEHDFIFTLDSGRPTYRTTIQDVFKHRLREAGLPDIRFHDLRHVCATLLCVNNVSPRIAMSILGHANIQTTLMTYTQVLESSKVEAVDTLDRLLAERKEAV